MPVEIQMPDFSSVLTDALQSKIDAALSVGDNQVRKFIVEKVIYDDQDAHGQQMPQKKPKPAKSPKNNPAVPLVQTGNLLDKSRWTTERVSETELDVVYSPPSYHQYLAEKGRDWLNNDQLNPEVRQQIEAAMVAAMLEQESNQADVQSALGKMEDRSNQSGSQRL